VESRLNLQQGENEEIQLLSLTTELAAVSSRNDLRSVLAHQLKELFPITGFGITVIDEGGEFHTPFLVDPEGQTNEDVHYTQITTQKYPVSDGVFDRILNAERPILLRVDDLVSEFVPPAYVGFWKKKGIEAVLGISLRTGYSNLGCLIFHLKPGYSYAGDDLLKGVSAQISVAVSRIRAGEEITKREEEKTILLSFSNEIADIKNRSDLFEVVVAKIKRIFGIERFLVAKINQDRTTFSAFTVDPAGNAKDQPDYKDLTTANYQINDAVFGKVITSEDPVLFDVELLNMGPSAPKYVDFWKRIGMRYVLIVPLRVGGDNIGFAILNFNTRERIDTKSGLLKGICAQLAVKVSNILANEEIEHRDKEKSILLYFTREISAVKTRQQLFEIITPKIENFFTIGRFEIARINEDQATFTGFRLESTKGPDYEKPIPGRYSIYDTLFATALISDEPVLWNVNELAEEIDTPPYVFHWKNAGWHFVTAIAFRVGGQAIGFAIIHVDSRDSLKTTSTLLKGICDALAEKMSQIMANEEIENREREKSILLSFADEIAAVRNRKDFFEVVVTKVKETFSIKRFGIAKINEDQETVSRYILDSGISGPSQPGYTQIVSAHYPLSDPLFADAMASDAPGLFDINVLAAEPGAPAYFNYWKNEGLRFVATIALRVAGKAIGIAILHVDEIDTLNIQRGLLQGICAQLAVKVSQIMAYEEIEQREQEKSMLLAFSNAIAAERDKIALAKTLKQQLKALFHIEDYVIHALSDNKKYQTPFLFDPDADFASHPDFAKLVNHWTDINDGVFDVALASPHPVTINTQETYAENPPVYADAAKAIGLKKMTTVALRLGQENIGVMNFRHDELSQYVIQESLFRSICSQIAVSFAHIMADEKVNQQLSEIKKYKEQLEEEKIYLKEEIETSINYTEIIGESPELKKVFRLIAQVAYSDSTVLLLGETGTGKELVARAIHNSSPRKSKLMIKVNCAAIPANLIESELFGHERGSFTGAVERRIGKFELANNGTLFLDEIGEMTLDVQVKLLRALQEKEIERVGGKTIIAVNARIVAATNRDLEKLMEEGKFRSDLYYRLNTFPITIPPLRSRKDDIPKLAMHFIDRYSKKTGKKIKAISNKVLLELMQYDWPGNIRELEHLIERSVLLATGDSINENHLLHQKRTASASSEKDYLVVKTIVENEKEHILKILKLVKGRIGGKGGAAELLGLPTSTLNSRIKKLGIRKEHMG